MLINPFLTDFILKYRKVAYVITDRNLKVVEIGGETQLLPRVGSGQGSQQRVGQTLFDLAPELIGNESEIAAILQGALSGFTLALVNREAEQAQLIYVNLVNLPQPDAAGNIVGIVHLVEDVTTSGSLEQRLTQQRNELSLLRDQLAAQNSVLSAVNTELRQMDELKSSFVSVAAHELRNPLASIMGYIELLEEDQAVFSDEHIHCIKTIRKSAQRLLGITNDLLDVTRIESGRLELTLTPTSLVEIVEDVADELQPQLDEKQQRLFLDATPELPLAFCDRPRTIQILTNLLSNAIKYTPEEGEIMIRLDAEREDGFIVVAVMDTGIGISQQDQQKLFRSFFRGSNTHLTRATGAGLGLSITKSLAELQGGQIWLESQLNKGSTFYVSIPADGDQVDQRSRMKMMPAVSY